MPKINFVLPHLRLFYGCCGLKQSLKWNRSFVHSKDYANYAYLSSVLQSHAPRISNIRYGNINLHILLIFIEDPGLLYSTARPLFNWTKSFQMFLLIFEWVMKRNFLFYQWLFIENLNFFFFTKNKIWTNHSSFFFHYRAYEMGLKTFERNNVYSKVGWN